MSQEEMRLWEAIRIQPVKWQQDPYGIQGGGFWVVGIIGSTVIWYNDIEEGFNRSVSPHLGESTTTGPIKTNLNEPFNI